MCQIIIANVISACHPIIILNFERTNRTKTKNRKTIRFFSIRQNNTHKQMFDDNKCLFKRLISVSLFIDIENGFDR